MTNPARSSKRKNRRNGACFF